MQVFKERIAGPSKYGAAPSPRRRLGFSLIELAVTLAAVAIVAGLAVPSLLRFQRQAQVHAALHAFSSSLAMTRMSAISRGHPVTMCPSIDGRSCTGGTDWSSGWIIYLDRARSSQPGDQAHIIENAGSLGRSVALRSSPGRSRVRYLPAGWASGSNLTLTLCTAQPSALTARLVVNNAGRTRIERTGAGVPCPHVRS